MIAEAKPYNKSLYYSTFIFQIQPKYPRKCHRDRAKIPCLTVYNHSFHIRISSIEDADNEKAPETVASQQQFPAFGICLPTGSS